jgi:transcriptional regulator with XRE-family HTH domain
MGNFQNVFRQLRLSSNLTQNEMAEKIGISRSTIGMYETGAREPDFETLEKIADYFNVDTDFLLGRTSQTTLLPETIGTYSKTRELTAVYEQLSPHNQGKVLTYSKSLLSTQQMEEDVLAAHARTDVEQTQEGVQHDLDIMNDDSMWEE